MIGVRRTSSWPSLGSTCLFLTACLSFGAFGLACAQTAAEKSDAGPTMQRYTGVWVEGPGFDITYGGTYEICSQRCLTNSACVMIEFYRPEKKCNLYNTIRPRLPGGDSIVAIRR